MPHQNRRKTAAQFPPAETDIDRYLNVRAGDDGSDRYLGFGGDDGSDRYLRFAPDEQTAQAQAPTAPPATPTPTQPPKPKPWYLDADGNVDRSKLPPGVEHLPQIGLFQYHIWDGKGSIRTRLAKKPPTAQQLDKMRRRDDLSHIIALPPPPRYPKPARHKTAKRRPQMGAMRGRARAGAF